MGLSLWVVIAALGGQVDAGTPAAPPPEPPASTEPAAAPAQPPPAPEAPRPEPRPEGQDRPAAIRVYRFAVAGNPGPMLITGSSDFVFTLEPGRLELEYAITPMWSVYALPQFELSAINGASGTTVQIHLYPRLGARMYLSSRTLDGLFFSADLGALVFPSSNTFPFQPPTTVGGFDLYLEAGYAVRLGERFLIAIAPGFTFRAVGWISEAQIPPQPFVFRPSVRITPTLRF